jgi:23S rRNA pseudouridine2605 synthase
MVKQRLQKVLAAAGWGSRRACEEIICEGRVSVNGRVCEELPVLVDPAEDRISVDGRPVRAVRPVYFLLHKPKGVFCTNSDPAGRVRAVDLLGGVRERVYPVGRLDAESTGLLLMTNDGDLAEHLMHPRYGIERTYRAEVKGKVLPPVVEKLRKGIWMSDGRTQPARVRVLRSGHQESVLEITLREGRNREVRRVLAALGHPVRNLKRTHLGPLSIKGLGVGKFRPLIPQEVGKLRQVAEAGEVRRKRKAAEKGAGK